MQEIKTAHWIETDTRWGITDKGEGHIHPMQFWLRLDPPASAWHAEYDRGSWAHDVIDERGHLHTASTWDICHLHPHRRPYNTDNLLQEVLFPPPQADTVADPASEDGLANKQQGGEWKQEVEETEGQSLVRWHREYVQGNFNITQTIWTEPQSHRIVRKERRETNLLTGKPASFVVCDQYVYNEESPAGTFEMPAGKPIVIPDYKDIMPEVWDTLSAKERQAVQETIDRSDAGWLNADFRAFASVWEFDAEAYLPHKDEWQKRVQQQAGAWTLWTSVVESANTQEFIPITMSAHSFSWGPPKHKVLRVKVKLHVTWAEEGSDWEGRAEYYLRRKGRGYRIVHWDCPWEEIKAARAAGKSQP